MKNKLRDYLTDEEMDRVFSKASDLESDLKFFKMYMDRNAKSEFTFELTPKKPMGSRLIKDIFESVYDFKKYRNLHVMLTDYYVAKKLINSIDRGSREFADRAISEILFYFKGSYRINLMDYVDDFVVCSLSASEIKKVLVRYS